MSTTESYPEPSRQPQPSPMIVVVPTRNQPMVIVVGIMMVLLVLVVGLLMWVIMRGGFHVDRGHDSVLLRGQDSTGTSARVVPAMPQTPSQVTVTAPVMPSAAPVVASTSMPSGGNAAGRSYDSLTVPATQCGSYDYAGMADYYDSYVSICQSGSGYSYRAHVGGGDLELPATKLAPGRYLVDASPHMIEVHEGIVTVTDSSGEPVRTVPLYDWKYEY